jgi:eukaryotic-like serine/threonine-protein kinase
LRRTQLIPLSALKKMVEHFRGQPALCTADLLGYLAKHDLLTTYQLEEVRCGRTEELLFQGFRLLDRIGSGGMGHVYLADHPATKARVAVKVLHADMTDDPTARARFEREGMAAHGLMHPNIVRVLEFQCDAKTASPYLVMEFVPGVSLQAVVALTGALTSEAVAYVGYQVAAGLSHAWRAKLVHRDIKPANLLLANTGVVKILDLGIVRLMEDGGLTVAGRNGKAILGTLDYLSPEQALDSSGVDCRADVYSLGATMYFLLAGQAPYHIGSHAARLMAKHTQAVTPIHHLRPDVSMELSAIISKMLERNPLNRYQTPEDVQTALETLTGVPDTYFAELFENIRLARAGEPLIRTSNHPSKTHKPLGSTNEVSPLPEESVFEFRDQSQAATIPTPNSRLQRTLPVSGPLPYIVSLAVPEAVEMKELAKTKRIAPKWWKNWVLLTLVGIGLVTVVNCLLLLFVFQGKDSTSSTAPVTKPWSPKPVVTVMANGSGDFTTLREAFAGAVPNQVIEIHAETWTENLSLSKNISPGVKVLGRSGTDKPTVWKREAGAHAGKALCQITNMRGITFQDICFDGENEVEDLVNLSNVTATFVNVQFRNNKAKGVLVEQSTQNEQLVFQQCSFSTSAKAACAVHLADVPRGNLRLSVTDCRFDGPMEFAVRISAPLQALTVERCRFHEVREIVKFDSSLWIDPVTFVFKRNVVASAHCGVNWANLPTVVGSKAELTGNVFEHVTHCFYANQAPTPWMDPKGAPEPDYDTRLEWIAPGAGKMYPRGSNNIVLNGTTIAGVPGGAPTRVDGPELPKDKTNDRRWLRLRPADYPDPALAKQWGVHE